MNKNRRKRYNTFRLDIASNFISSSTKTSSYSAEEEINPHWKYDSWELRTRSKKAYKNQKRKESILLQKQNSDENTNTIPLLNLKALASDTSSGDTLSKKYRKHILKNLSSSRNPTRIHTIERETRNKETPVHLFSNSARSRKDPTLDMYEPNKSSLETYKRHKRWKSFGLSKVKGIKIRKGTC